VENLSLCLCRRDERDLIVRLNFACPTHCHYQSEPVLRTKPVRKLSVDVFPDYTEGAETKKRFANKSTVFPDGNNGAHRVMKRQGGPRGRPRKSYARTD
jgi:hypothetical protein